MRRLRVAPIVEGHGEVESVRVLLERTWLELLGGEFIEVKKPIRQPRGRLVQKEGVAIAVRRAVDNLAASSASADRPLILILIDADEDCPAELGPKVLSLAREANSSVDIASVVANVEYETWFVAAAESLVKYLNLPAGFIGPESPEASRHAKAWVERNYRATEARKRYSESQDQPAMTAAMDLDLCRERSPSFDKLCRELERRLRPSPPGD